MLVSSASIKQPRLLGASATLALVSIQEADKKEADEQPVDGPGPVPASDSEGDWLDLEIDRVWLLSHGCLRRLQRDGLRPSGDDHAVAEVERILLRHHQERGRAFAPDPPIDDSVLDAALLACEKALATLRPASPIGRLSRHVELTPLDLDVLILTLAPHTDPPLSDVFALLQKAWSRRAMDLSLIGELLRLDRGKRLELLSVLDPDRPLISLRLISVEGGDPSLPMSRPLAPGLDLVPVLAGHSLLSSSVQRVARLIDAPATLSDLIFDAPIRELVNRACAVFSQPSPPLVLLYGPPGAGKSTIAARLAAYAGRQLLHFDTTAVSGGAGDEMLRRVQRDALLHQAVLYVGPVAGELLEDEGKALLRRFRNYSGPVIFGLETTRLPRFRVENRAVLEVGLNVPSLESREKLWDKALGGVERASDFDLWTLSRSFRITPGEIKAAAAEVLAMARSLREPVSLSQVREAVARRLRNRLGEYAEQLIVHNSFRDMVLADEQVSRVEELLARACYSEQVFGRWGFGNRLGWGHGLIALFSGPPGTGKTMLASLIAKELGLDIYRIDLSRVVSKWVGETEKVLGRIFDLAEKANAVLLFDEADALLAGRTRVASAQDRYGNTEVNYLLQRLEQHPGIVMLTTNQAPVLDPALQRRLALHLRLDMPEVGERERLWRSLLPPHFVGQEPIDYYELAEAYEFAGGHIKNVALRAAFFAASEGRSITREMIERAAHLESEDMGKLV